jgi:uncharacterized protein (DUF934 family)
MPLIKNGRVADDPWTELSDDAPPPAEGDVIVSLSRLSMQAGELKQRPGRLGVRIAAGEDVMELAPHLDALALVALDFPKFGDGRAFSSAALLRGRLEFKGEVRAVGAVLRDQLFYMVRCGFDAFEIARADAAEVFAAAVAELSVVYQAAADGRRPAWARRRESVVATAAE